MNENDYLLAWAAYGIAALGLLLVWIRMTCWMWRLLREPLRVLVAVLLLTPTMVEPSRDLYAPAIAVAALDIVFKVGNLVWSAAADLALFGMIAYALYLIFALIRWPLERRLRARREAAREDPRTLRERLAEDDEDEPPARDVLRAERS